MSEHSEIPVCYRHPDRQTRLGCSSCGRPVCVDCAQRASVGQLCPECVRERGSQRVIRREQLDTSRRALTPVSMTILGVCVAVFLVARVSPEIANLTFTEGAQLNRNVDAGEWYRVLTAAFLHADLMHIVFNMLALYIFGPQLEREVGSSAFLALFMAAAAAGGAAFYLWEPTGLAVGASGAIFGLFGAWLAAAFRHRHTDWGRASFRQLLVLLAINMALPLFIERIAWQAHLGGLLAGIVIISLWTLPAARQRTGVRVAAAVMVLAAALSLVIV